MHGNLYMLRLLLSKGGDILARSSSGVGLMHVAAQSDKVEVMAFLVQSGLSVHEKDKNGASPLHWAVYGGAEHAVLFLLSQNASLEEPDGQGNRPLHLAVVLKEFQSTSRILKLLLGKNPDKKAANLNGYTCFDLARLM